MRYLVILIALLLLVGCDDDGDGLTPAPAIDLTLAATDSTITFVVKIPQNLNITDQNTANFVYTTAVNSGLSSIQQATQIQAAKVEERRQSWQTFWLGLFALSAVIVICMTVLLKGVVQQGAVK